MDQPRLSDIGQVLIGKGRGNDKKKAARTVVCSCREASDATRIQPETTLRAEELLRAATHAHVE
jgi:hypothetical protein